MADFYDLLQIMCPDAVGDLYDHFFIKSTGVATDVDVFVFIRFKNGYPFSTGKNFVFTLVCALIRDLKIKQFTGSCYTYPEFSMATSFIVLIKTHRY